MFCFMSNYTIAYVQKNTPERCSFRGENNEAPRLSPCRQTRNATHPRDKLENPDGLMPTTLICGIPGWSTAILLHKIPVPSVTSYGSPDIQKDSMASKLASSLFPYLSSADKIISLRTVVHDEQLSNRTSFFPSYEGHELRILLS